jgi:hypothetical protein
MYIFSYRAQENGEKIQQNIWIWYYYSWIVFAATWWDWDSYKKTRLLSSKRRPEISCF